MIPADVVSRLKLATDLSAAPTAPAGKLKDALSDLVPGQRVMAEIQALMPNGTYRAMVAQREVILALPNSAKSGDTLELQVVENDGKLAFALLTGKNESSQQEPVSVSTSLSRTGQLIGDLLNPPGKEGQKPSPAPLNGNQPLMEQAPAKPADLIPVLKQAITQSGLFYESHQAQWAEGKLPTAQLVQQPQGQLSDPVTLRDAQANPNANPFADALKMPLPELPPHGAQQDATDINGLAQSTRPAPEPAAPQQTLAQTTSADPTTLHRPAVSPELAPLVQQQLEALATQNYAWQGQVWPGQQMDWEITNEGGGAGPEDDEYRWQTRLNLKLPQLGDISATLRLRGQNQIDIQIQTRSADSEMQLSLGGPALNQQMEDAGLDLAMFGVARHESAE